MRRFRFPVLVAAVVMLLFTVPGQAQSQPDIDRVDANLFIGLNYSDRASGPVPAVEFGVQADYVIAGPLFVGASAGFQQGMDATWEDEPTVAVDTGLQLPGGIKAFGTLNDIFSNGERQYGGGLRYKRIDARAIREDMQWGLTVRFALFQF